MQQMLYSLLFYNTIIQCEYFLTSFFCSLSTDPSLNEALTPNTSTMSNQVPDIFTNEHNKWLHKNTKLIQMDIVHNFSIKNPLSLRNELIAQLLIKHRQFLGVIQ